ncbi:sigma-70 family RNA polymerase sigma factor [Mycolicibacterium sp. lyk4-40-TYG-92]|uniref:sigma-70 family RNA polymerase sigma factor n=1 Tax=Mycolicibacterium sp. lyk4-40-TYG-92 TaxID=3040295 RepID=UPI00254F99E3|nr:sigma-70 family RNA polymerase sigma factor [Mycolicibacterium sp. lyk4-40-TYG-92]
MPDHPDWAALYQRHRDAMYRVAAKVLREVGLADQADDAVQAAMFSLMKSPPAGVVSWEAVLVRTTQRRALDIVDSAVVRHAGPPPSEGHDTADPRYQVEDIDEAIDRQRQASQVTQYFPLLTEQQRFVAWEYVARDRPRSEVAAELGVTPARVSQISTATIRILRDAMGLTGGSR